MGPVKSAVHLVGHYDAVIDGVVVDVRSPNKYIKKGLFLAG